MDTPGTIMQTCTSCGVQHGVAFQPSVNVTRTPSLREKIASGEYFISPLRSEEPYPAAFPDA